MKRNGASTAKRAPVPDEFFDSRGQFRGLSLAARGLYLELWEQALSPTAQKPGYLPAATSPEDSRRLLSQLSRCDPREIEPLLDELLQAARRTHLVASPWSFGDGSGSRVGELVRVAYDERVETITGVKGTLFPAGRRLFVVGLEEHFVRGTLEVGNGTVDRRTVRFLER